MGGGPLVISHWIVWVTADTHIVPSIDRSIDRAGSVSSPEAREAQRPLARLLPRVLSPQGCRKAKPLKIWLRPWTLVWRWLWSWMLEECIDLCPSLSSARWLSLMNIPPSSCFPYRPPQPQRINQQLKLLKTTARREASHRQCAFCSAITSFETRKYRNCSSLTQEKGEGSLQGVGGK